MIEWFGDSGGGTGFDLAGTEFEGEWIQYVRVDGPEGYMGGEIDAFADVSAVPIPGAIWLLGSGLVGLMGLRRSRKIS